MSRTGSKVVDINDILHTISTWKVESGSTHNDGYTREYYLGKIYKVEDALNRIKEPKVIT